MSRSALALACFAALSTSAVVFAQEGRTYDFQYTFRPTTSIRYRVHNTASIDVQYGGAEQQVTNESTTFKHLDVVSETPEGNAVIELWIDSVSMEAKAAGRDPVIYDSESGDLPPLEFEAIDETVGKPLMRMTVTPKGEVVEATPLVEAKAVTDNRNLNVVVPLPADPVRIGDSWKENSEIEILVTDVLRKTVKLQRVYRLVGVEENIATFDWRTVVLSPIREPAEEAQVAPRAPSGTVKFDMDLGLVVERTSQVDKTVVGFQGPNSSLATVTEQTEELLTQAVSPADLPEIETELPEPETTALPEGLDVPGNSPQ